MAGQIIHPRRWRLYFNNKQAAPLVCSLDNGDTGTEFTVRQACLHNIKEVFTSFAGTDRPNISDPCGNGRPMFCVEFEADLKMEFGIAHFWPCEPPATLSQDDFVRMGGIGR